MTKSFLNSFKKFCVILAYILCNAGCTNTELNVSAKTSELFADESWFLANKQCAKAWDKIQNMDFVKDDTLPLLCSVSFSFYEDARRVKGEDRGVVLDYVLVDEDIEDIDSKLYHRKYVNFQFQFDGYGEDAKTLLLNCPGNGRPGEESGFGKHEICQNKISIRFNDHWEKSAFEAADIKLPKSQEEFKLFCEKLRHCKLTFSISDWSRYNPLDLHLDRIAYDRIFQCEFHSYDGKNLVFLPLWVMDNISKSER